MKLLHFGFRVHDVEKTAAAWRDLFGRRDEPIHEFTLPTRVGALTGEAHNKVTHLWTDDGTEIEFVQSISGPCTDEVVLGEREGMSHVAFQVDDLAAERARAEARGLTILSEGGAPRASWFFIHDEQLGGALVQLVQLNPKAD